MARSAPPSSCCCGSTTAATRSCWAARSTPSSAAPSRRRSSAQSSATKLSASSWQRKDSRTLFVAALGILERQGPQLRRAFHAGEPCLHHRVAVFGDDRRNTLGRVIADVARVRQLRLDGFRQRAYVGGFGQIIVHLLADGLERGL